MNLTDFSDTPLPLHLLQRFMPEPPQTLHASGSGTRPKKSLFRPPGASFRSGKLCVVTQAAFVLT